MFSKGQICKYEAYGNTTPVRVARLFKGGSFAIEFLDGRRILGPFGSSGWFKGYGNYRVVPMADGETIESVILANDLKKLAGIAAAEAKRKEELAVVFAWWNTTGEALWASKVQVPHTLNSPTAIYSIALSEAVCLVTYTKDTDLSGKTTFEIKGSGFKAWNQHLDSFSTVGAKGETLEEAFYHFVR